MGALGPKPLARLVESRCQIFSRIQRIQFNSVTRRGVFNVVCFAGCFFYGSYKLATRKKVEQALNADGGAAPPFPEIKSTHSLVAKHVTPELWAKLSGHKTATSGFTLAQAIACAVQFDDQHCGIYAGDEDSYKDFAEVFDPLIQEYHGISADATHTSDMDVDKIKGNIDPAAPVHSCRIRVGRSIDGFGLSPGITKEQRVGVENLMKKAFANLKGDLL